jgi:purine-binding chemotaxis protein CheW
MARSDPAPPETLEARAQQLRRNFDNSFAELPRSRGNRRQAFLAIGAGQVGWALRMEAVAGIYRRKQITALPGGPAALLGLTNIRGAVIPVYDLRVLLNADGSDAAPSWLVITALPQQIGLAFDRFDGYVQHDGEQVFTDSDRQTLRTGAQVRAIVDLPALLESITTRYITNRTHASASQGE